MIAYGKLQDPLEHDSVLSNIKAGTTEQSIIDRAEELNRTWTAGKLPVPCVWLRRMAFVSMPTGGVIAYSPVELTPDVEAALKHLGGVKAIVLANIEHAKHWEGWKRAFPEAPLVMPAQCVDWLKLPSWAGEPLVLRPGEAVSSTISNLLHGLDIELVGQTLFNEIVLHHRDSGTLLTTDFVLFSSNNKSDKSGWMQLGSCTDLFFEVFLKPVAPLMPSFRMDPRFFSEEDKHIVWQSLQRILSWRPQRILASHAGGIAEGEQLAQDILHSTWNWCKPVSILYA